MPVLEKTTLIKGRSCAEVFDFCMEGVNFPKIFPERVTPLGNIDIADLRIAQGRQFRFRHWMLGSFRPTGPWPFARSRRTNTSSTR